MQTSDHVEELTVEAVVFDFDGLICDTESAQERAVRSVFADHGVPFPSDAWSSIVGTAADDDVWVPWLNEAIGDVCNRDKVMEDFSERNAVEVAKLQPNDGVILLLAGLAKAEIPIAIASSSPASWVRPLTRRLGLERQFAHIICREHAPKAKPAPDLYLEALTRLGIDHKRAHHCVALEDSRNGSLAAKAAGMICIAVPGPVTAHQDFGHVDHVISSLALLSVGAHRQVRISK